MIKHILFFLLLLAVQTAKADFVDIATLKVNGVIVRKMTNNSQSPYLVNLGKFYTGDTLSMHIWTDNGSEENTYFTIQNLKTLHTDTLERNQPFILTPELLEQEHLITVVFIYDRLAKMEVPWKICKIIPDPQIEKLYTAIDDFRDFVLSVSNGKTDLSSPVLNDSITANYSVKLAKNGLPEKILTDTLSYPTARMKQFISLSKSEKDFFKQIHAIDYVSLYYFPGNLYGSIDIGNDGIDSFVFLFSDFTQLTRCYFSYSNDRYKLEKIFYEKLK